MPTATVVLIIRDLIRSVGVLASIGFERISSKEVFLQKR
jgi:hypothetical protein